MRDQTFPRVTFSDWEKAAEASLKGKSLSKLYTKTVEGIELKPFYSKEDVKRICPGLPGEKPFTRGFYRKRSFPETKMDFQLDPISLGAESGIFPSKETLQNIHNQSSITVDTVPYHMGGANAVQELAVALSEAVYYMELFGNKNEAASKMVIHFAAGPHFFTELAKLRAFRTLWSAVMDAYELNESLKPLISVETSELTLSALDPHVNILRTGNAAFAAVLGNVDYLYVTPFDQVCGETSDLSKRIARNIPLLLKHEAHLDKVIDPAGGSYYIESLTEEIGRLAWDQFVKIEEAGGIEEALRKGIIQKEIALVQEKREQAAATRKQPLIGTNVYADLAENDRFSSGKRVKAVIEGEKIIPLKPRRLAEPFEQLRQKSVQLQQTGQSVEAGLLCLGELQAHKPRADYVAGVLAVGGVQSVRSKNIETIEEAVQFVRNTQYPYYCICGENEAYEQFGQALVDEVKKAGNGAVIESAGKWQADGLSGSIAAGDNIVRKLTELLSLFEGSVVQ